jgi:fermentation-respiration switch protein FrsA (DUF1100 family)
MPGAEPRATKGRHVDLYDQRDKIPFNKLAEFFTKNLAATPLTETR